MTALAAPVETRRGGWAPLVVAVAAMAMMPLAVTGTNLAFGEVEAHFAGTSRGALSFILSGYSIVLAAFTLLGGQLSDRLGSYRMFLTGIVVFALAGAAAGLAPHAFVLIAARVVQGAAGALIVPSSLAMALARMPVDRHATTIGVWTAAFPIGSSVAPTLAALILEVGGWRWVFLAPVPLAAVLLVYVATKGEGTAAAPPSAARRADMGRPDVIGIVIGTAAVGLAALGIVEAPRWGWLAPSTLAALIGAAVLAPAFVWRAKRNANPLVPLELFAVPTFRIANIANVLVSMVGMSVWLLWPLQMRQVWGYGQVAVGIAMTPTPAIGGAVAIGVAKWARTHGYRLPLVLGTVLVIVANVWFAVAITQEANYWWGMFPGLVIFGFGMGMTFSPLNGAALVGVPAADIGRANATFNTGRFLSGAIGIAAVVAALGDGDAGHPNAPFDRAYLLLAGLSAAASLLLALTWPRQPATAAAPAA